MIELRDVTFSHGDDVVLESLSVQIDTGSFAALAGLNGSGKTTLLRLCNGLLTPDSGTVLVNGTDVTDDPVAARTAVGLVFQNPRDGFVAASVGDDVAFGPRNLGLDPEEIDRRVSEALAAVRMGDREADRIDTLSGGEQSRVAIAGALAMKPAHLALDEPLVGLDHPTRRTVLEHVREMQREGTGIIVATHDLRDIWHLTDRVIGLHRGRIFVDDSPETAADTLSDIGMQVPDSTHAGTYSKAR